MAKSTASANCSTRRAIGMNSAMIASLERVRHQRSFTKRLSPGFMKLLDRLERGDVPVVTKLDRLGRNAIDVPTTVARLAATGVRVRSILSQRSRSVPRSRGDVDGGFGPNDRVNALVIGYGNRCRPGPPGSRVAPQDHS
jgi:hypothetical protein